MNLSTLKPAYHSLPQEQRLLWLERIRTNRLYPTGRMCNYLSWQQLPNILQGDNLEHPTDTTDNASSGDEADSLDLAESSTLPNPGLLPPLP